MLHLVHRLKVYIYIYIEREGVTVYKSHRITQITQKRVFVPTLTPIAHQLWAPSTPKRRQSIFMYAVVYNVAYIIQRYILLIYKRKGRGWAYILE